MCGSFGTLYKGVGDNGSFFVMKEVSLSNEGKLSSMLGQIACGLLNHYFLEFTKGIMFAYEIKITIGQWILEDSTSFMVDHHPHPLDLNNSTFCTFIHKC